jgi:hypothetical protein
MRSAISSAEGASASNEMTLSVTYGS